MAKADSLVHRGGTLKASLKMNKLKAKESYTIDKLDTLMMGCGQEIVLMGMVAKNGRKVILCILANF